MKYEPTWESLNQYEVPEWYQDAKFGIFIHWGVSTVTGGPIRYGQNMYREGQPLYERHKEKYGGWKEFGYKDFIPLFKPEKFDPDEWAELFRKSRARYVVQVATHHDGFAMYDSSVTEWCAAKMGPKRDFVGDLSKAVRKRGMKFGTSSHYAFCWRFYSYRDDFDTVDPRYEGLYLKPHDREDPASPEFLEHWYARTTDIIDKYEPDIMWFDFGWNKPEFEPYRQKTGAHYYNKGIEWGKDVVLCHKGDDSMRQTAVHDLERGIYEGISERPWMSDTKISQGNWAYTPDNDSFWSTEWIIHNLVEVVSKNGCLLLNVGPSDKGTITEQETQRLIEVGEWLDVNGEAIFETRPWKIYGEGPTKIEPGGHNEKNFPTNFHPNDIRFTSKGNTLYAICLAWPEKEVTIKSLAQGSEYCKGQINGVRLLGSIDQPGWERNREGLTVKVSKNKPCSHACVFKISIGK